MEGLIVLGLISLVVYFAPALIAANRGKKNASSVFFLNLLLGWTLLGWAVAMVWAFASEEGDLEGHKKCPECAETVKIEALKCRFCGHRFESDHDAGRSAPDPLNSKEWQRYVETLKPPHLRH